MACGVKTRARLQWLVGRADSRELHADIWWRGWIGFYGAGMLVQSGRAGLENDSRKRADLIVSAVNALGGTTRRYFSRPVARLGADPLRVEPLPNEEARLERVAQGEAFLQQAAEESPVARQERSRGVPSALRAQLRHPHELDATAVLSRAPLASEILRLRRDCRELASTPSRRCPRRPCQW